MATAKIFYYAYVGRHGIYTGRHNPCISSIAKADVRLGEANATVDDGIFTFLHKRTNRSL